MAMPADEYTCRVCGFRYETPTWECGYGSHDICVCCGTQFGYGDTRLEGVLHCRATWAEAGYPWSMPEFRPPDWEPRGQLVQIQDRWADAEVLALKQATPASPTTKAPLVTEEERTAVLRRFLRDGRLTHFPATHREQRIVLEHIASCFEPGVTYRRLEVDKLLKAWHSKPFLLLMRLTGLGLLDRDNRHYWRRTD